MKLGLINSAWAQAGRDTTWGIQKTKELGFDTIDATRSVDEISDYLNEQVTALLTGRGPRAVLPAG